MRSVKKRTLGTPSLAGLGRAMSGFFSGRMVSEAPSTELEEMHARAAGQQSYYRDSPSPPEVKKKVAIKMGRR